MSPNRNDPAVLLLEHQRKEALRKRKRSTRELAGSPSSKETGPGPAAASAVRQSTRSVLDADNVSVAPASMAFGADATESRINLSRTSTQESSSELQPYRCSE